MKLKFERITSTALLITYFELTSEKNYELAKKNNNKIFLWHILVSSIYLETLFHPYICILSDSFSHLSKVTTGRPTPTTMWSPLSQLGMRTDTSSILETHQQSISSVGSLSLLLWCKEQQMGLNTRKCSLHLSLSHHFTAFPVLVCAMHAWHIPIRPPRLAYTLRTQIRLIVPSYRDK